MYFRILGPLEVIDEGGPVQIPSAKVSTLLIALLTRANDIICVEQLTDWLWPAGAPRSAVSALYAHVSVLRKLLEPGREPWGPPSMLITKPPGYLLRVPPGDLDVLRFEELVHKGRTALAGGDPVEARACLRDGLALWHGEALADVLMLDAAQAEIHRLKELRLTALTLRFRADLVLGRHQEAVPELMRLTSEHPLREDIHALLMLALWRSGRRADALAVYESARETLAKEMALEPEQTLRQIEAAIVAGEPFCSPTKDCTLQPWCAPLCP